MFKEKTETWIGKLVRLKTDCNTHYHSSPKGLVMRVDFVTRGRVTLKSLPCSCCGIASFMVIKGSKETYHYYFEFVDIIDAELAQKRVVNE